MYVALVLIYFALMADDWRRDYLAHVDFAAAAAAIAGPFVDSCSTDSFSTDSCSIDSYYSFAD